MAMNQGMAMMMAAQARRRRDERGRFMEGGQMAYGRGGQGGGQGGRNEMQMGYAEGAQGGEMRRGGRRNEMAYNEGGEMRRGGNRNETEGGQMRRGGRRNDMGGEGYFVWDGQQPYMPPERYGQPENVTDMRQYNRTRSMMGEGGEKQQEKQGMIGFGEHDKQGKKLTKEKAEKWVKKMRSDDRKGEMWSMEDAKELAKAYDITEGQELIDFYAALNMVYSDYSAVAKEWGVDEEEYYAALACAFLYDRDGKRPSEKLAAYYKYVVPHDEED